MMRLNGRAPCGARGIAPPAPTCAPPPAPLRARDRARARRSSAPPPPPPRAAPLGSTVSVDDVELPPGFKAPRQASKDGKVLHPDLINPNILKTQ